MTEKTGIYNNVAPLRNVAAMMALMERVQARPHGLPGLAAFYGPSGWGKSTAAGFARNEFQAYFVQMKSVWTRKKLCESILIDLGLKPGQTVADMVEQVSEHLARTQRLLIIDEADYLVAKGLIEVVRDIYESSGAGIILIGEELLPQNLQKWERVHGRMLDWVQAEPGEARDVVHLAKIYCRGVELDNEMMARILAESRASIRRICVNLDRVREWAVTRNLTRVSAKDWGAGAFVSGEAPAPRRAVA